MRIHKIIIILISLSIINETKTAQGAARRVFNTFGGRAGGVNNFARLARQRAAREGAMHQTAPEAIQQGHQTLGEMARGWGQDLRGAFRETLPQIGQDLRGAFRETLPQMGRDARQITQQSMRNSMQTASENAQRAQQGVSSGFQSLRDGVQSRLGGLRDMGSNLTSRIQSYTSGLPSVSSLGDSIRSKLSTLKAKLPTWNSFSWGQKPVHFRSPQSQSQLELVGNPYGPYRQNSSLSGGSYNQTYNNLPTALAPYIGGNNSLMGFGGTESDFVQSVMPNPTAPVTQADLAAHIARENAQLDRLAILLAETAQGRRIPTSNIFADITENNGGLFSPTSRSMMPFPSAEDSGYALDGFNGDLGSDLLSSHGTYTPFIDQRGQVIAPMYGSQFGNALSQGVAGSPSQANRATEIITPYNRGIIVPEPDDVMPSLVLPGENREQATSLRIPEIKARKPVTLAPAFRPSPESMMPFTPTTQKGGLDTITEEDAITLGRKDPVLVDKAPIVTLDTASTKRSPVISNGSTNKVDTLPVPQLSGKKLSELLNIRAIFNTTPSDKIINKFEDAIDYENALIEAKEMQVPNINVTQELKRVQAYLKATSSAYAEEKMKLMARK